MKVKASANMHVASGFHRAIMSRYIHELADHDRDGGPGLGLLRIDEGSYRPNKQEIYLTKKGHAVAMAMLESLRSPQTERPLIAQIA
jgi:hypothetical protein